MVGCGLVEELERFWDDVHDQTGRSSVVKTATLAALLFP